MKKTILITGCSSGIGRELAIKFQQLGCTVIATARNIDAIQDLVEHGIIIQQLDVNDPESINAAIGRANREAQGVDMLINNAGFGLMGPIAEVPLNDIRQQFETNVFAPVALAQAIIPGMVERGHGCIVNIGSIVGHFSTPFLGSYCASKAAIRRFSDALRIELQPFNIDVVAVEPGGVSTQFAKNVEKSSNLDHLQLYQSYREGVIKRARSSLNCKATPKTFANNIAPKLLKAKPKPVLRYGDGSYFPRLIPFLPLKLVDWLLRKVFGLVPQ
tara:strand:+ start:24158 stop:24976 length:819 start_codon:yes stop_codon:yes gene_type:complete